MPEKKIKILQQEAIVEVTSTVLGKKAVKGKKIKVRAFATDPATVGVKYGVTIPTGDYASARVDVFLSAPCYKEEMVDVYKQLQGIADTLVSAEVDKITGGTDGKKT